MVNHSMDDFHTYSTIFREYSFKVAELMKILHTHLSYEMNLEKTSTRDLYDMVRDLMYNVDAEYKKEKNIKDDSNSSLYSSLISDDLLFAMRTLLKDEFDRYLNGTQK